LLDLAFRDPHALWAAHASGSFSQLDLRSCTKPIDAISRVSTTWNVQDSLTLISDLPSECEIPYDDVYAFFIYFLKHEAHFGQFIDVKMHDKSLKNENGN
jgi:hypothetical protein